MVVIDGAIAADDLGEYVDGSLFWKFAFSGKSFPQRPRLAELSDNVDAILGLEHLLQTEDVLAIFQHLQCLDLGPCHLQLFIPFVCELGDHLYGYWLF